MNRLRTSEIARRLAERDDVEPPEGLLEKIKNEIPPALSVAPEIAAKLPTQERAPQRRQWLIAASVAAAVCGGVLALRVMETTPRIGEEAEEAEEAPSSEAPLESRSMPQAAAPAAPSIQPPAEEKGAVVEKSSAPEEAGARERDQAASQAGAEPERQKAQESLAFRGGAARADRDVEGGIVGGVVGGTAGGVVAPPPPAPEPAPQYTVDGVVITDPAASFSEEIRVEAQAPVLDSRRISSVTTARREANEASATSDPVAIPRTRAEDGPRAMFTDAQTDRLSTFGLDVDTASYTVVRSFLRDGRLPPPSVVRVEEMVNFFSYGDPAPARGEFAIRAEGAPSPFAPGPEYRLLRFNLRAREVKPENRRPAVLTLVIDVSGSMNEANRLGLVKKAIPLLLEQMRPEDKVGVVVYGDTARIVLEPTADREAVRRAVEGLVPEGSTNAEEGLVQGYAVASRHFRPGGINRVVLCSDGVANVGKTGAEDILARIGAAAKGGIELTTLGFGMGDYNDTFMERLANKGNGRYAYVDTLGEARRVLVEEITGALQTVARDAKVQVDFNPAVVERWRLLGYENRAIADQRFRDDSVDAGEIGAGHSVTALYEVKLKPGARPEQRIATFQLRFREPDMGALQETARELRVSDLAPSWEQAPAGLRFASVVAELAEILQGSPETADGNLKRVLRRLNQVAPAFEKSSRAADVADLVKLVRAAVRLQEER